MKKEKTLLILNTVSWISLIITGIIAIILYIYVQPYPEKYTIAEMDHEMIEQGEGVTLFFIYFMITLAILCFVFNLIVTNMLVYYLIKKHEFLKHNLNNGLDDQGHVVTYMSKSKSFWSVIGYMLLVIAFNLAGFIALIPLWVVYHKTKNMQLPILKMQVSSNGIKGRLIATKSLICIIPIVSFSVLGLVSSIGYKNIQYDRIPDANVRQYLTFSNNHPNVLQLYFDRATGMAWNMLLIYDYLTNKNNSFIAKYPEFTSYINTVSLSKQTKNSNPVIYAGYNFDPFVMDFGQTNTFSNKPNQDLTVGNWYFNALATLTKMYQANGIQTIKYNNLPWYGKMSLSPDYAYGDMDTLQKDFNQAGYQNVVTMTNTKLAYAMDGKRIAKNESEFIADGYCLEHLGDQNWATFQNTSGGVYTSFFSQQCHEPYVIKQDGKLVSNGDHANFLAAQLNAIHDLQNILDRLKKEPYYTNGVQDQTSVYDHTLILINSDHGFSITKPEYNMKFEKLVTYLSTQSINNKPILTTDQVNIINNFAFYNYNPVVMFKPLKYNQSGAVIHSQAHFQFNDDQLIALSDLSQIIQNYLNEYHDQTPPTASYFVSPQLTAKIANPKVRQMLQAGQLTNPLDPQVNSFKNHVLTNRHFYIFNCWNWKFWEDRHSFEVYKRIVELNCKPKTSTIFDNNNFRYVDIR